MDSITKGAKMLSKADLDYAQSSAREWYDDTVSDAEWDEDLRDHFADYFRLTCDDTDSLDNNIPSIFRVWRAEIAPMLVLREEN